MTSELLQHAEWETAKKGMTDRELLEFTADRVWDMQEMCESHRHRLDDLEKVTRNSMGIAGGIGGVIVAVVGGIVFGVLKALGK